jgi:hypothetical protein
MRPEDISEHLEHLPFKPFRIHLTDGKAFDITHPDMVIVSRSKVIIGVPRDPRSRIAERVEHCALLHIVRVDELQPA